ncbi:hypothetical protein CPB86DRAFT_299159, partial [Serendipita vermifera]
MDKPRKPAFTIRQSLALASNPALAVASPSLSAALQPDNLAQRRPSLVDRTDVAINSSIASFKAIKEAAEAIPQVGSPIKVTSNVMILVLETIRRCKDNRDGWRELAEIMQDKNQRVTSLLGVYAQAPEKYEDVLEQAIKYQKILNEIASDMKKETETESEKVSGLEGYWERMKVRGRETALSEINAKKIASYRERLRDQALSTTEVVGIQIIGKLDKIEKRWEEEKPLSSRKATFKPRPPLVDGFVGRNDILEAMRTTHFEKTSTRHNVPRVTVLTGLGGSGKTQIALKFASEFEEKYTNGSVYFLDASSQATLEADLKTLVKSQSDTDTDAIVWLATIKRDWIIIMDNADDPSLDLAKYLPRCTHGHVIITSRNRFRTILSPKSAYHVDSLPLDEATSLLLATSGYEDNEINKKLSKDIAKEVGCLPLALAHAGAYILFRQCLGTYLDTYRNSRSELLGRKFDMAHDYPYSVATTVKISFEKLSPRVQELLGVLSHLDARSIPCSIIETAARRHFEHIAKNSGLPVDPKTIQCASTLRNILVPEGDWSSLYFDDLIEECEKYSLVQLSIQDGERFYSMHILVQVFLQATCGMVCGLPPRRLVARLLGSAVTIGARWEYLAINQSLSSHLRLVNLDDVTEAGDHYGFGNLLKEVGDGQLAVSHMECCLEIWRELFGEESKFVLDAMEILAQSYSTAGKEKNALGIRESVMEKRREVWGEDHLETLHAINNLA